MAELVKKRLLRVGEPDSVYHAPQEKFDATDINRALRWKAKFHELKAKGLRFPIPFGHRQSAMPIPEECSDEQWREACEQREFEEAYWNAGYIEDCDIEDTPEGKFFTISFETPAGYKVDCPSGDLINEANGTRIGEASGAWGTFRSGDGETHKDILIHAALCTKPVAHGHGGFELAKPFKPPTTLSRGFGSVEYSFTASLSGGKHMAKKPEESEDDELEAPPMGETDDDILDDPAAEDEEMVDDAPVEEEPIAAESDQTDSGLEEVPEPMEPMPEEPLPPPTPINQSGVNKAKEIVRMFGEIGLALPPHTDEQNLVDYLYVSLMALQNAGFRFEPQDKEEAMPQAPASGTSNPGGEPPPVAENPPIMMSTTDTKKPAAAAPAKTAVTKLTTLSLGDLSDRERKALGRDQKRVRAEVASICEELKTLGCPVWMADELKGDAGLVTLSLRSDGEIVMPPKLKTLRTVKKVLQAMRGRVQPKQAKQPTTLSTGTRAKPVAEENPAAQAAASRANGNLPPKFAMDFMAAAAANAAGPRANGVAKPSAN